MKNLKTTVLGILAGLIPFGQGVINSLQTGQSIDFKNIVFGILIMAFGVVAKDFNVSGT
jgi:hypothetical protein